MARHTILMQSIVGAENLNLEDRFWCVCVTEGSPLHTEKGVIFGVATSDLCNKARPLHKILQANYLHADLGGEIYGLESKFGS